MFALVHLLQEGGSAGTRLVDLELDLVSVIILVLVVGGLLMTVWAALPSTIAKYASRDGEGEGDPEGPEPAAPPETGAAGGRRRK